ncbi:MAG: hypothetical protein KC464_19385, partial [Myxococcales bacterium]|nr:hypothetical protein [Myxococcales bacterium]
PDGAGTYVGVLVGDDGSEAVIDLVVGAAAAPAAPRDAALPVTGTARFRTTWGEVAITGTYDPRTGHLAATVAGPALTIDATFDGATISAHVSSGGVAWTLDLVPGTSALVDVYCGSFTGSRSGRWTVLVSPPLGVAGGAYAALDQGGAALGGVLGGTVTADVVDLTLSPAGAATGTLGGDTLGGTWTAPGGLAGTFAGSTAQCPTGTTPTGEVTGITATATPTTIASGETSALTAQVTGTGAFDDQVTWVITSGGGTLALDGGGATYTAPVVTATTVARLTASAVGDPTITATVTITVTPPGATAQGPLATVAIGSAALLVRTDGTLWAWGSNQFGQLGTGDTTDHWDAAVPVGVATDWAAVAAGNYFSLALKTDGTVWAWGLDQDGELGGAGAGVVTAPTQIPGLTDVVSIGAGEYHALAVRRDGTLWAWGANGSGQCGVAGVAAVHTPTQVAGVVDVIAADGGHAHTVAFARDAVAGAKVWTFGDNGHGELGDATTTPSATPRLVAALANVTAVAAGYQVSTALAAGDVYTWGSNDNFMLGDAALPPGGTHVVPFATGVQGASSVTVTSYETIAAAGATVEGAGANLFGLLGAPSGAHAAFAALGNVTGPTRVVASESSLLLLLQGGDGTVRWLGTSPTVSATTPTLLLTDVRAPTDAP